MRVLDKYYVFLVSFFYDRYRFPVHSSEISMTIAVTSLRIESVFGKSPATLVRRLIWAKKRKIRARLLSEPYSRR